MLSTKMREKGRCILSRQEIKWDTEIVCIKSKPDAMKIRMRMMARTVVSAPGCGGFWVIPHQYKRMHAIKNGRRHTRIPFTIKDVCLRPIKKTKGMNR